MSSILLKPNQRRLWVLLVFYLALWCAPPADQTRTKKTPVLIDLKGDQKLDPGQEYSWSGAFIEVKGGKVSVPTINGKQTIQNSEHSRSYLVLEGSLIFSFIDDGAVPLNKGQLMIVPTGVSFTVDSGAKPAIVLLHIFD